MISFARSGRALAVLMVGMTISGLAFAQRASLPDAQEYEPRLPPYQTSPAVLETRQGWVANSTQARLGGAYQRAAMLSVRL
jgi:hypothetical protein